MRRRIEVGFSLIEAAVVIAVVAILVGVMAPLSLKLINQRREALTRESLKQAFEALFGAADRRVANLRADIGFNPVANLSDLSILLTKAGSGGAWAGVRDFDKDGLRGVFWGYNGPYWTGSVINGKPVDGWGRPLELRIVGGGWQVYSLGSNGIDNAFGNDDLVYPPSPAQPKSFSSVLNVNLQNSGNQTGTVVGYSRNPTGTDMAIQNRVYPLPAGASTTFSGTLPTTILFNPVAGGFAVAVTSGGGTSYFLYDLNPGETREAIIAVPPGNCATPSVPFNRSGSYPAEDVTIALSWANGTQTQSVTTKFNNGQPGGNPPPSFTNLPQGLTITAILTSDKRGALGSYTFTLGAGCSTPAITF